MMNAFPPHPEIRLPLAVDPWQPAPDLGILPVVLPCPASRVAAAAEPEEDDEIDDEEDLAGGQPLADEESSFDDFDDEFDDDFEEETNDPDWDHPDEGDSEPPPPAKGPGKKK